LELKQARGAKKCKKKNEKSKKVKKKKKKNRVIFCRAGNPASPSSPLVPCCEIKAVWAYCASKLHPPGKKTKLKKRMTIDEPLDLDDLWSGSSSSGAEDFEPDDQDDAGKGTAAARAATGGDPWNRSGDLSLSLASTFSEGMLPLLQLQDQGDEFLDEHHDAVAGELKVDPAGDVAGIFAGTGHDDADADDDDNDDDDYPDNNDDDHDDDGVGGFYLGVVASGMPRDRSVTPRRYRRSGARETGPNEIVADNGVGLPDLPALDETPNGSAGSPGSDTTATGPPRNPLPARGSSASSASSRQSKPTGPSADHSSPAAAIKKKPRAVSAAQPRRPKTVGHAAPSSAAERDTAGRAKAPVPKSAKSAPTPTSTPKQTQQTPGRNHADNKPGPKLATSARTNNGSRRPPGHHSSLSPSSASTSSTAHHSSEEHETATTATATESSATPKASSAVTSAASKTSKTSKTSSKPKPSSTSSATSTATAAANHHHPHPSHQQQRASRRRRTGTARSSGVAATAKAGAHSSNHSHAATGGRLSARGETARGSAATTTTTTTTNTTTTAAGRGVTALRTLAPASEIRAVCAVGKTVWCAHRDGAVTIHRPRTGTTVREVPRDDPGVPVSLLHVPATRSVWLGLAAGGILICGVEAGPVDSSPRAPHEIRAHSAAVTCSVLGSHGTAWTGGADARLHQWDTVRERRLRSFALGRDDAATALLFGVGRLWSGHADGALRVWDAVGAVGGPDRSGGGGGAHKGPHVPAGAPPGTTSPARSGRDVSDANSNANPDDAAGLAPAAPPIRLVRGHSARVTALVMTSDAVWSACEGGTVNVWAFDTDPSRSRSFHVGEPVSAMCAVGNQIWIATRSRIRIHSALSSEPALIRVLRGGHPGGIAGIVRVKQSESRVVWSIGRHGISPASGPSLPGKGPPAAAVADAAPNANTATPSGNSGGGPPDHPGPGSAAAGSGDRGGGGGGVASAIGAASLRIWERLVTNESDVQVRLADTLATARALSQHCELLQREADKARADLEIESARRRAIEVSMQSQRTQGEALALAKDKEITALRDELEFERMKADAAQSALKTVTAEMHLARRAASREAVREKHG
jgi:hypothetical protein